MLLLNLLDQPRAVVPWHVLVDGCDGDWFFGEHLERAFGIGRFDDREAFCRQPQRQYFSNRALVVDDEDVAHVEPRFNRCLTAAVASACHTATTKRPRAGPSR